MSQLVEQDMPPHPTACKSLPVFVGFKGDNGAAAKAHSRRAMGQGVEQYMPPHPTACKSMPVLAGCKEHKAVAKVQAPCVMRQVVNDSDIASSALQNAVGSLQACDGHAQSGASHSTPDHPAEVPPTEVAHVEPTNCDVYPQVSRQDDDSGAHCNEMPKIHRACCPSLDKQDDHTCSLHVEELQAPVDPHLEINVAVNERYARCSNSLQFSSQHDADQVTCAHVAPDPDNLAHPAKLQDSRCIQDHAKLYLSNAVASEGQGAPASSSCAPSHPTDTTNGATSCSWHPGGINRPLERLMFGDSPKQDPVGAELLGELLDTPPDDILCHFRGDAQPRLVSRSATQCADGATARVTKASDGQRLAVWFIEHQRGDEKHFLRAAPSDEVCLCDALSRSMEATRNGRGGPAKAELFARFRAALGGVCIDGLRCVPLDGDTACRLPAELSDPCVSSVKLPSGRKCAKSLAGTALQRAKAVVEELLRASGPAVFKIGITCSPLMRFRAYERDGYHAMHLLFASEEPGAVQMLEAALIDAFRERMGCRNKARGGEGPVGRAPYFTYLALAPCGTGVGLLSNKKPRREQLFNIGVGKP